MLNSIQKHASSIQRYVHISSIAAIQSLDKLDKENNDDYVFSEKDWNTWSTVESDPYGYAKTKAEQLVWEHKDSMDIVVLNPAISLMTCLGA